MTLQIGKRKVESNGAVIITSDKHEWSGRGSKRVKKKTSSDVTIYWRNTKYFQTHHDRK